MYRVSLNPEVKTALLNSGSRLVNTAVFPGDLEYSDSMDIRISGETIDCSLQTTLHACVLWETITSFLTSFNNTSHYQRLL